MTHAGGSLGTFFQPRLHLGQQRFCLPLAHGQRLYEALLGHQGAPVDAFPALLVGLDPHLPDESLGADSGQQEHLRLRRMKGLLVVARAA